jgi:D-lyxose ketol-isomerase
MFAFKDQVTPLHTHKRKKEDIIVRWGKLNVEIWDGFPDDSKRNEFLDLQITGKKQKVQNGTILTLAAGERVTLTPGIYHAFWPITDECIIGEVSTANDDLNDNFFVNPDIGRFSEMVEDESAIIKLVSDKQ